jgi:hypothetical protein
MIRKGDIVTIKPEWRSAGEARFTYVARNDEEKGRVDISALELKHWRIWPVETVSTTMLED